MYSFKFGQVEVASCNNGKEWWYILKYQVDEETIIPLYLSRH